MTKSRSPTTVPKSSRPSESRDGLTEFDLSTAFYMSEGRLCARFPYCPHRGWVRCELETDADQADYVCRFTEYIGLYADQTSRVDDFFWPLGMTCN